LAFFAIGPYMAWLFLILAVIMLGPFYFWLLKFLALIILALIIWPFWRGTVQISEKRSPRNLSNTALQKLFSARFFIETQIFRYPFRQVVNLFLVKNLIL